jgi:hypothetical protein
MADSQTLNLVALNKSFYREGAQAGAATIEKLIKAGSDKLARHLLRHHSTGETTDRETWLRDEVDYLLSYYSLLEIALEIAAIRPEFNNALFANAGENLKYPPLVDYYELHYPLELPQRLRLRIQNGHDPKAEFSLGASQLFFEFQLLTAKVEFDQDMESYLWVLDGGYRDWNYDDLIEVLGKPRKLANYLNEPTVDDEPHRIIRGMVKFLEFCVEFVNLLGRAADFPALQRDMYVYHSYWFVASEEILRERLYQTIGAVEAAGGDADLVRSSIQALSGQYVGHAQVGGSPPLSREIVAALSMDQPVSTRYRSETVQRLKRIVTPTETPSSAKD